MKTNYLNPTQLKKILNIFFTEVVYYLLLGIILYFGYLILLSIISSLQTSLLTFGEVGLINNIETQMPKDLSEFQNASIMFESSKHNLLLLALSLLILTSLISAVLKGFGYCRLRGEKFTFVYLRKAFLFNIIWRGSFFAIFLLGIVIIKPEMLFLFWLVLLCIFYYFTPIMLMKISKEKGLRSSLRNAFVVSIKKLHIILGSYLFLFFLSFLIFLLVRFFSNIFFYVMYLLIIILVASIMKVFLFKWIN